MKTRTKLLLAGATFAAVFVSQSNAQLTVDGNFNVIEDQNTLDGVVFYGEFDGSSSIPATGAGTRFMWYPKKAAIRAGRVTGTQWDDSNIGVSSVGLGDNVRASSEGSVALGHGATAGSGTGSVALGRGAFSWGEGAYAAGLWAEAVGQGAVALGENWVYGTGSFAAGQWNEIDTSVRSVGIGVSNYTNDTEDVVMIGRGNEVEANSAVALGRWLNANIFAMLALGQYNESISGSSSTWVDTDPLFVIGNGTAWNTRSNAMVVRKNGNTTINGDLDITGEVTITYLVPQGDILMGDFGN